MLNLVDADILAYRAASSCEPTKAKPFLEPQEIAIFRLHDMVQNIIKGTNCNDMEFYIQGDNNFRKKIYPDYKANRTKPAPNWLQSCREILVIQYGATVVNDIETDDMLGIRQTQLDGGSRIVSIDKDLLQIPGSHYNFVKMEHRLVSPLDGLKTFYKQLIAGDGTDNIPSFDGKIRNSIPKFVEKLQAPIDEMTDPWEMYVYVGDVYLGDPPYGDKQEDYAMKDLHRNAQLLYILKDYEQYWQPPQ